MFDWFLLISHLLVAALGVHYGIFHLLIRALFWAVAFVCAYWLRFATLTHLQIGAHSEFASVLLFAVVLGLLLFLGSKIADSCSTLAEKMSGSTISKIVGTIVCTSLWAFIVASAMTIDTIYSINVIAESRLAYLWRDAGLWLFAHGQLFTELMPDIKQPSDAIEKFLQERSGT